MRRLSALKHIWMYKLLQIAIDDLNNKYGIIVLEDTSTPLIEEPLAGQLTLFDNITQSCCRGLQQAA